LSKRDFYEVLGVDRSVGGPELKASYRKLALQYHPDRNPDDDVAEERFKELSEAYAVLSDPDKRARYDQFGHAGIGGSGQPDFGDMGGFGDIFNDLFGDLFGGGRGGRQRGRGQRGADLRYNLEVDMLDVLNGAQPSIKIPKMRQCESCEGSGGAPGSRPEVCDRCRGAGQIAFQQGFFRVNRPCDICNGAGEIIRDHCKTCRGAGRVEGQQTIQVKIPAGVDEGARLRLVGEGEAGIAGGPPGDLYVVISMRRHPLFERDNVDLHCEVPVPFVQAALGSEIDVPTLEGKVTMSMPEGTQSGTQMRLRGKGLPPLQPRANLEQLHRMRGDLYVRIFVEVPTNITGRKRELLEEFADLCGTEVSPVHMSFMDKLRDFFD
jgi:molecular chaperone DnaJ